MSNIKESFFAKKLKNSHTFYKLLQNYKYDSSNKDLFLKYNIIDSNDNIILSDGSKIPIEKYLEDEKNYILIKRKIMEEPKVDSTNILSPNSAGMINSQSDIVLPQNKEDPHKEEPKEPNIIEKTEEMLARKKKKGLVDISKKNVSKQGRVRGQGFKKKDIVKDLGENYKKQDFVIGILDLDEEEKKKEEEKNKRNAEDSYKLLGRRNNRYHHKQEVKFQNLPDQLKSIEALLKKNPENMSEFKVELLRKGIVTDADDDKYLESLLSLRSYNKKFTVNRKIFDLNLVYDIYFRTETNIISTDFLYLMYLYCNALGENKSVQLDSSAIQSVSVVSFSSLNLNKEDVQEYFIQDYDPNSFISFEVKEKEQTKDSILQLISSFQDTNQDFGINDKKYKVYYSHNKYIIIPNTVNVDNYLYNVRTKQFQVNSKLKEGLIKLPKQTDYYYVQSNLEPTLFSPSVIVFPYKSVFLFSYRISIDPNEFINNTIQNNGFFNIYENAGIMENFVNLNYYIGMLSFSLPQSDLKEACLRVYSYFTLCSQAVKNELHLYNKFKQVCNQYLDIFGYKIKLVKLANTIKSITTVQNLFTTKTNTLNYNNFLVEFKSFIRTWGLDYLISKYLDYDKLSLLNLMLEALKMLQNSFQSKGKDLREKVLACTNIIISLYNNPNQKILTGIKSDVNYPSYLTEIIDALNIELVKLNDNIKKEKSKLVRYLKNLYQSDKLETISVINNAINTLINRNRFLLDEPTLNKLKEHMNNYLYDKDSKQAVIKKLIELLRNYNNEKKIVDPIALEDELKLYLENLLPQLKNPQFMLKSMMNANPKDLIYNLYKYIPYTDLYNKVKDVKTLEEIKAIILDDFYKEFKINDNEIKKYIDNYKKQVEEKYTQLVNAGTDMNKFLEDEIGNI